MNVSPPRFADRAEAGRSLAARLAAMRLNGPIIYALPRGGVPVAAEIARALHAPLALILVRKIGAPGAPELALGAVADGERPVINEHIRRAMNTDPAFLEHATQHAVAELDRRRLWYLAGRAPIDPAGRIVIVVDDGLATGATARAALAALRRQGVARTILAIPVAPAEAISALRGEADEIVCLYAAPHFRSVGAYYADFHQLTDEETVALLPSE